MPYAPVITISCPRALRTSGDIVAGVLNFNVAFAEEKDVVSVKISLRGEINTQVTVDTGASSTSGRNTRSQHTYRDSIRLFTLEQVLWVPDRPLPPHSSGTATFPFSFVLPATDLPPSFHSGTIRNGGSVKYYLHAVAARKSWYQRNIRVDNAFPFLPFDRTAALSFPLPNWPGEWQIFKAEKRIRRGIISHYGLAQAEFYMPKLPLIPLFRPIPIRLRIICTSKPLSRSAADNPDKFEFPRNPKQTDIDLTLRQVCTVSVRSHRRQCTDYLGLQAGFGRPNDAGLRATWGNQIQTSMGTPRWVVDANDTNRGCWSEEITFSSMLVFRCPTPFSSPSITSSVYLDLSVDFPGIGNKVNTQIGPLPLTSGIPGPDAQNNLNASVVRPFQAEPDMAQADLISPREMDLPPSYYEVIHMDEKEGARDA